MIVFYQKKWALLLTMTIFFLSGCVAGLASDFEPHSDELVIGLDNDPPQLDPHRSSAAVDRQVFQSLFNTLIDIDEDLNLVPELAKSWEESEDGMTYTFYLEENVSFHDGTPFNAEAVTYNFERMLNPDLASPRTGELGPISEVNVLDEYTVEVIMEEPFAPFLAALTDRAGMMVSPQAIEENGDQFANQPVGTGPYIFENRVLQSELTMQKNEDYWRESPQFDRLVYRPFTDENVRGTNLVSGGIDIVNKIAFKDVATLEQNEQIKLLDQQAIGFQGIHLNTSAYPFDNKNVRQALNIAIDRNAISKVVFYDAVEPAASAIPPNNWAHNENLSVPEADLEEARELLEESGLEDISFTLKISPAPEEQLIAQMVQAMLDQIDVEVNIEMVEFGTLLSQLDTGDFQAVRNGWSGRIDPDGNLYRFMKTDQSNNYTRYSNENVDSLLDEAQTEIDQTKRKELYDEISEIVWDDAPYIYLYYDHDYKAMKQGVEGFKHIPDTMIRTETLFASELEGE
ncbi:ABC transporter substrate-binding protein [Alkalicoccobacillus porphyridii]|uniref:ABC transporter substrate-binding protein n=1 Tax=Alkalicoccobacillus porphyridii TaxID=2597270 RepID=A0A553ZWN0_9BACI|nr:ABC transporter substrate-binding protein [Alkalicoccobacillus porphyridii]TSB45756.1 ABC transporter substrate-binding protein [Alkalicoccobacillus porphyridii]